MMKQAAVAVGVLIVAVFAIFAARTAVVAPGLVLGRTDSRHFSHIAEQSFRFLQLRIAKSDMKRIHGTNERVSISNYVEIIQFYVQLLRNTAL